MEAPWEWKTQGPQGGADTLRQTAAGSGRVPGSGRWKNGAHGRESHGLRSKAAKLKQKRLRQSPYTPWPRRAGWGEGRTTWLPGTESLERDDKTALGNAGRGDEGAH